MLQREYRDVAIDLHEVELRGDLRSPPCSKGLVIFAHGSGSSRRSPRNVFVAESLQEAGFSTLLFDLLTEREDENYETRFDIELLSLRLNGAARWAATQQELEAMPVGLFGASTGAAVALRCAADLPLMVQAVVSRGGRPDLAASALSRVIAPTLFIVGGADTLVLKLNEHAMEKMRPEVPRTLEIVPGATHLFEEPGTLKAVSRLAAGWFETHLVSQEQQL